MDRARCWGAAVALGGVALVGCGSPPAVGGAAFAGSAACAGCHPAAYAAWAGSLHAQAAQAAAPGRVQAPFDGRTVVGRSAQAVVRQEGARLVFVVEEDGRLVVHPAALVLGRAAVEQFLVPRDGGRLQAFPLGYDPVAGAWFDIFPEAPSREEWTHWTQPGATANSQCLECHVTGYVKGYDPGTDTYATRWAEDGVGCEACHGPGGDHVVRRRTWHLVDPWERYGAIASPPRAMERCAGCHSRRVPIAAGAVLGARLADHFDFELLDTDAYHADGQLRGEAFEWTSFQMSRMGSVAGVVCQDCHAPHGGGLRAHGNALCLRCHPERLAEVSHTHHAANDRGARCVECHMPEVVFMERDARRDHRIGRPDPEGAAAIDAPDACTRCHTKETPAWAASWVRRWWGPSAAVLAQREQALTFHAARQGDPAAVPGLRAVLGGDVDAVRRASAARLLGDHVVVVGVVDALVRAAGDREPVVRAGAVQALGDAASTERRARAVLLGAVRDPARLVRLEAAFALRAVDLATLSAGARAAAAAAFTEWVAAQDLLAELPETHFNRGLFLAAQGRVGEAEAAYRTAIRRWPADLTPRQNLALLLAEAGRAAEAEQELRTILAREPAWPPAAFALGLLYAGDERWREAVELLEACRRRDPAYPRAAYNLGLAYRRLGEEGAAAAALAEATRDPAARAEALRELVRLASTRGDEEAVRHWLPLALRADPTVRADPRVRAALGDGPEALPTPPDVP